MGLFRSGPRVPDLIVGVGLAEWFTSLSADQREKLHEYSTFVGTGGEINLLDRGTGETSQSAQAYLKGVGSTAASVKDYEFAEMVLREACDRDDGPVTTTHFTYNELINLYYKQRGDREDAIEKCIEYCKKGFTGLGIQRGS